MKIDVDAFMNSLPIMGIGLLGIFIVTIVIIVGIYILKAATTPKKDAGEMVSVEEDKRNTDPDVKKESAMDLMKEREKKDFFETDSNFTISKDL
jgi:hypothetical protein